MADNYRPPTINGVGASCVGLPAGDWPTMLDFLVARFAGQPRDEWERRLREGKVHDENGNTVDERQPYRAHTRLYYYRDTGSEIQAPIDAPILYRDAHLLVVDKPHGVPVVPSGRYLHNTLLVHLRRITGIEAVTPIHRLDRDTAGIVMFSLQQQSRDAYHALFRSHQIRKIYEAIAPVRSDCTPPLVRRSHIAPGRHFLQQCEQQGPVNAVTELLSMRSLGARALYRLQPTTGHRHQLRVHMAAWGVPIVGDGIYPQLLPEHAAQSAQPLQLLARSIAFTDPLDGTERTFTSQRRLALDSFSAGVPES